MPAPRKLPDTTTLRMLRRQGWTLGQIGERYGVSESAVWKAMERGGLTDQKLTYRDLLPWIIEPRHQTSAIMDKFRHITKERNGEELTEVEARRLADWIDGMAKAGVVVAYHPDAPPNAASRKTGGFYYTPRTERDAWIIQEPATDTEGKEAS